MSIHWGYLLGTLSRDQTSCYCLLLRHNSAGSIGVSVGTNSVMLYLSALVKTAARHFWKTQETRKLRVACQARGVASQCVREGRLRS